MAETAKAPKWTEDRVATLRSMYVPGDRSTVDAAAETLEVTPRAVIGKLVSIKEYVAPEKPVRAKKDDGPLKGELLNELAGLGYDVDGLDGATKAAISRLIGAVQANQTAE